MSNSNAVEILKSAILLEMRGETFYKTVAENAQDNDVKEFFNLMAEEELTHINILSAQLKEVASGGNFKTGGFSSSQSSKIASNVLTKSVTDKLTAASFEAAAIGAAISMEFAAVKLYSQRAKETKNTEEKALYVWLAKWEQTHLDELSEMDTNLKEEIWNDNNFWPY
jgi:rubrerythrin